MTPRPVARPMHLMRWLSVAALASALAGCTVPSEDGEGDPLFGLCPQWAKGPGSQVLDVQMTANESVDFELGPANGTHKERPLDLYRIHVDHLDVEGRTELRAMAADGTRLNLRDYRLSSPQLVPVVVFTNGSAAGSDFDVFLSPVGHDDAPLPAPVTLHWTQARGNVSLAATVTFHYKVCGF